MEKNTSSGVSGATLLLILFIALKLTGVIHWSWWWVLAPCWVPLLLTFIVLFIVNLYEGRAHARKNKRLGR